MVKTVLPLQGPLVGKLRSHMLHGVAKKEETTHIFTGHKCQSWIFLPGLHSEPKLKKLSQNLDFKLIFKKKKKKPVISGNSPHCHTVAGRKGAE